MYIYVYSVGDYETFLTTKIYQNYSTHIQWSLIITATCGLNICDYCIEVTALQQYDCTESHHFGLEIGGK